MDPLLPLATAAALALGITGLGGYQHYGMFSCEGRFGRFASNGQLDAMPSQLTFIIDWQMPGVVTDSGIPGRITAWTPLELAFDIQYPAYKASYFINRIDGSISETSNFGGVFRGACDLTPVDTKF
jgi:hypothetical protein